MTNKHGKLKAVFYYDSMEHVKLVDQAVGRLDTAVLETVFNNLKGTVCAPLIRENLEITEFAIPEDGEISAAQVRFWRKKNLLKLYVTCGSRSYRARSCTANRRVLPSLRSITLSTIRSLL